MKALQMMKTNVEAVKQSTTVFGGRLQFTYLRLQELSRNRKGQDLIEYALMAGFVAVAAGAIMPQVASSISTIFSQINSVLSTAASQGS